MSARVAGLPLEVQNLMEDAEDLVRIDGAHGQIVVGISAVVEVEAAEHAEIEQPRHDLFDVLRLIMMARIHQHLGARARAHCASSSAMPQSAISV